jgi:hypothetical protein
MAMSGGNARPGIDGTGQRGGRRPAQR